MTEKEKTKKTEPEKEPESKKESSETAESEKISKDIIKQAEKETKKSKPEKTKEFAIPLRKKYQIVPRYKKTNKAVKAIKEFIVRHMKIYSRDLKKVKIDKYLNEFIWRRGIRNPPHKIKVKAYMDSENNAVVELAEIPEKLLAKKLREEKRERIAESRKVKLSKEKKEDEKKKPEEKKEFEEKKASVIEEGKKIEKAEHKQAKHTSKKSEKSPVIQRKALAR